MKKKSLSNAAAKKALNGHFNSWTISKTAESMAGLKKCCTKYFDLIGDNVEQ